MRCTDLAPGKGPFIPIFQMIYPLRKWCLRQTRPAQTWQAVGNELQGCALMKVAGEVVLHEKITYFSQLPD